MEKGIYKYSPALQFEIGRLGSAFVNLCTQSPSLYIDLPLYESQSIGGLNLHCYVLDAGSTYETFTFNCTFKFSYDVSLTVSSSTELCVNNPSGSKHKYQLNTSNNRYESLEDKSYIVSLYNEETCLTTYTLFDESENENIFVGSGTTRYLNTIKLKNGKEITITRDTSNRITQVKNPLADEMIQFQFYESIFYAQVKRLSDNEWLYEYIFYINNNEEVEINYMIYNISHNYRRVKLKMTDSLIKVQDGVYSSEPNYLYSFTRNAITNRITKFTDNNNNITNISYGNRYATITNNRNDERTKYVWDHIGRLTHVYDLKRNTFSNISYDSYNHVVIKSSNLFTTKILNPNFINSSTGKTNTFDYQGKVNDLFSVIVEASYNYTLQFKINIVFEKLDDNNNVIESDSVEPYDYDIYNYGTSNPYVFSTYSNINFNRVKVVITETQGSGTYSVYLYNAGFTENYLYKGKLLVGALKYGSLVGLTAKNNRIVTCPLGSSEYDEKDRLIEFTDSYGNIIEYTYDENNNVLSVKTRKGSYVTTKTYTYDSTNNRHLTEKDDSVSSLTRSVTTDVCGLLSSSKVINSSNTELESVTAEYNTNSTPLYNKLTQVYNHNNDSNPITDVIEYTYENKELVKATFDGRSVSYTINEKPHDYDNVKLNNTKFVEYTYKTKNVSGVEIATELIESKTYQNGAYYFEYDSNDKLTTVKYSESFSSTDATILHTFEYKTINGNDVLSKVTSTSPINGTNTIEYCYDKYGNFIGKCEQNANLINKFFINDLTTIEQFNSRCLFTKKDFQKTINNMLFNQKIRSFNENIKLCSFESKMNFYNIKNNKTEQTYGVLYNYILDNELTENSNEYNLQYTRGFQFVDNNVESYNIDSVNSSNDISYITIPGNEKILTNDTAKNLVFCFSDSNNILDALDQTIIFMFRNNFSNNTSSILLTLKNYNSSVNTNEQFFNNSDDLYFVLENKNNISRIKVCKFASINDKGVYLEEIESLTTELTIDDEMWHFVSITYSSNKLSLFVDGFSKNIVLSNDSRNINLIYFGQWFPNNYNEFNIENNSASFDLTNIMIPYKKALSCDRVKDIYDMFQTRNFHIDNDLLNSTQNDFSYTTFHTITQNIFSDNIEYISFSKTLSSLHGLRPKIDRTLTTLSDTILDKFMFDEETLNYAYKLCGQPLEYELESSKYKDSFGVSFMLKVNSDDVGQHNIMKFLSEELSFAIAYIDGKLVFETTGSNPKELDINKNQWVLITLEMGKTIDNCSNQVYEYTFDLYINGDWKHRNKVQLDTEFEGFDELVFDFNDTHNCFNETPCLIKDMIITDSDFTSTQMDNMLKMNNKSFINTQFDSLGLKTQEVICEDGNNLIETTFGYETNTRFKDELIKLHEDTSNSRKYTYVFDDYGRVTEQKTLKQSSTNVFDSIYNRLRYTYDAKGQLITDIINHNELPSGIAHQYNYDKYGNIESYKVNGNTVHSFDYDEYNRMITFDNKTVTYNDKDGMISLTPSTIGDDTYSWQGRRLMSISGTKNIQFEYNDQGLRTFKRVDTGQTLNSNKIYKDYEYVYDLENKLICQRVTYLNTIDTMIFLYHDDYLYGFEYAQSKYFYLRDSLGNINGIIDSTGKLVVEYVYNAFGKIIDILGEMKDTIGVNNPMRYKGYYYDSETQMYYCKSRYYNPDFCRWISGDSEKFIDKEASIGINLFIYCFNDPISFIDLNGCSATVVGIGIVVLLLKLLIAALAIIVVCGTIAVVESETHIIENTWNNILDDISEFYNNITQTQNVVSFSFDLSSLSSFILTANLISVESIVLNYQRKKAAPRIRTKSRKEAYQKAFYKGGKKPPIFHNDKKHGKHYHPASEKFKHWHYYFSSLFSEQEDEEDNENLVYVIY